MGPDARDKNRPAEASANEARARIWVVAADLRKARLYRRGPDGEIEMVDQLASKAPAALLAGEAAPDAHFVAGVAEWLEDFIAADAVDRFILVAAGRVLSALRERLHNGATARMMAQIEEDVSHLDEQEMREKLGEMTAL